MTEKEFRRSIDDCIVGKKDKDLVTKVGHMEVCSYQPLEVNSKKIFCRYIGAIYSCDKGTFYTCTKNLAYLLRNQRLK